MTFSPNISSSLLTPSDLDVITISDITDRDLDQDGLFPFLLFSGNSQTGALLTLSLVPSSERTVQVTGIRSILLDYIDTLTDTATGISSTHFLTLSIEAGQTRYTFPLLTARQPLSIPTSALFTTFLTPSAALVRPLPPTAQYEPLHLLVSYQDPTENKDYTAPSPPPVHATALWLSADSQAVRTSQTLTPALIEDFTFEDTGQHYLLFTLNAAPTLLTPPDDPTTAPYQLLSYTLQSGPRRQSYRIIPPSLTLTTDGPRPVLYANTFYLPEVIYFFGSTTRTYKPTYTSLRTSQGQTINYERTLQPTYCLHTGPLFPSTLRLLPDLLVSPHPYLMLTPDGTHLQPITPTEASHAPTTTLTDLHTSTLTYRVPADTFLLTLSLTARTFDPSFDLTFH